MKSFFLGYMLDTMTGTPRNMSKVYLKYISIHIHNFEHTSVIMNMKLFSHGFLFHRNINRENKYQIPLIIHHNQKNQRIYF